MTLRLDISPECVDNFRVIMAKPLRRHATEIDMSAG